MSEHGISNYFPSTENIVDGENSKESQVTMTERNETFTVDTPKVDKIAVN